MLTFKHYLKIIRKSPPEIRSYSSSSQELVRVRFAPSPTGFLHLGGLRTALYNYFFAKRSGGKFILRIEDTDQTRLVEGAIEQLQTDLNWAGIEIHEGPTTNGDFGPYVQSQRLHLYQEHVRMLLENNTAYYCFCNERRLELLRKDAMRTRQVPKYDNRCRSLDRQQAEDKFNSGVPHCVRFKLSSGMHTFNDLIYGDISYDVSANEGDPVIMKSDGFPTYHFANVVDDHLMRISHVLRGVEWQISTTKHVMLYRAFDWKPPRFGHLPLLMNSDGTKLSKRQGDIKISHYRESGVFPLALINFIATSGGGFEKDSEQNVRPKCLTMDELSAQFDVSRINSHSGKLMAERLLEFNRLELKRKLESAAERNELIENVREMIQKRFSSESLHLTTEHIDYILNWAVNRITKLSDLLSDSLKFVWVSPEAYTISGDQLSQIETFIRGLEEKTVLDKEQVNSYCKQFCADNKLKYGGFMKTLRSILSGLKEGPGVAEMMEILGKDTTLERLKRCIEKSR